MLIFIFTTASGQAQALNYYHNDVKISAFPKGQYFGQIIFIIRTKNRENFQFLRHNDRNRYAQILIMKIILTDIYGIFPH